MANKQEFAENLGNTTKSAMSCPHCKEFVPCPVMKSEGVQRIIDYPDIVFRRRIRACSVCRTPFATAEGKLGLIDEITNNRELIAQLKKELASKTRSLQRVLRKLQGVLIYEERERDDPT
jgi:transcriptional regulator NrdR family protein